MKLRTAVIFWAIILTAITVINVPRLSGQGTMGTNTLSTATNAPFSTFAGSKDTSLIYWNGLTWQMRKLIDDFGSDVFEEGPTVFNVVSFNSGELKETSLLAWNQVSDSGTSDRDKIKGEQMKKVLMGLFGGPPEKSSGSTVTNLSAFLYSPKEQLEQSTLLSKLQYDLTDSNGKVGGVMERQGEPLTGWLPPPSFRPLSNVVPEPSSIVLAIFGSMMLLIVGKYQRRKKP